MDTSTYLETTVYRNCYSQNSGSYVQGGFHPVALGQIYNQRYLVIRKLDYGSFSTVWLCYDLQQQSYSALKIYKSKDCYSLVARDQIKFYQIAKRKADNPSFNYIASVLDHFQHEGPHGKHQCIVMEVLNMHLYGVLRELDYQGMDLECLQKFARQVLEALDFIHNVCGLIHTDINLEHVMIQYQEEEFNSFIVESVLEFKNLLSQPCEIKFYDCFKELILTEKEKEEELRRKIKREKKKRYRWRKKGKNGVKEEGLKEQGFNLKGKQESKGKEEIKDPVEYQKQRELELFNMIFYKKGRTFQNIKIKIIGLGNGCPINKHYSSNIQTRPYRSPEIVLGIPYNETADIWSFACILFQMFTGDILFKPLSGRRYTKQQDHLIRFIGRLGPFDLNWAKQGKNFSKFFHRKGNLRWTSSRVVKPIKQLLVEKHKIFPDIAANFLDFIQNMLVYNPEKRCRANQALRHPWLYQVHPQVQKMTEQQQKLLEESFMQQQDETAQDADVEDNDVENSYQDSSSTSSYEIEFIGQS